MARARPKARFLTENARELLLVVAWTIGGGLALTALFYFS